MKTFISILIQTLVIGVMLYYTGLLFHPASLLITAIALLTVASWRMLARQHQHNRLDTTDEEDGLLGLGTDVDSTVDADSLANEAPHPISVVLGSLAKATLLLAFMLPFFGIARLATSYRVPFEARLAANVENGGAKSVVAEKRLPASANVSLAILNGSHKFIAPDRHFIDIKIENVDFVETESLQLSISGEVHPIESAKELTVAPRLDVDVQCDLSPSIVSPQPFFGLAINAAQAVVRTLQSDVHPTSLRLEGFGETTSTLREWTSDYANLPLEKLLRTAKPSATSGVANALATGIDTLTTRGESVRILVTISDFSNNVPSSFTDRGLAAKAKSSSVVLIPVVLKTPDFPEKQFDRIEFLAAETGGICIDGAAPNIEAALKSAFAAIRRPYRVLRLMFDAPADIDVAKLAVTAAVSDRPRLAADVK